MIRHLIPGTLALGLAVSATAQPTAPAPAAQETPAVTAEAKPAAPKLSPEEVKTNASFAIGFGTANQVRGYGFTPDDLENESFVKGFMAGLKGGKPEIEEAKLQAAMQAMGEILQGREKQLADKNLEEGKKFLETNGKREGVITTKSGLQYEVLEKGGSEKYVEPKDEKAPQKQFLVNYKGTLISGKEFDASPPGKPVPMSLMVIEGFKEALTMMPVGAKWKLFIPANLAYGPEAKSPDLGPNSTLIFELELVKIEDAPARDNGMPFPMPMPEGAEK